MSRATLVIVPDEGAAEMVRAALVEAGIQPEFARARPEHPYHPSVLAEPWRVSVPAERLQDARNALMRLEHEVAEEADAQARAWEGRDQRDSDQPGAWPGEHHQGGLDADLEPLTAEIGPRAPRLLTALALGFVLPFPAVCFYAHARRLGALLLGLFLASVGLAFVEGIWSVGLDGLVLLDKQSQPAAPAESDTAEPPAQGPSVGPPAPVDVNEKEPRTGLSSLAAVEWISLLGLAAKLADLAAGVSLIALARRRETAALRH